MWSCYSRQGAWWVASVSDENFNVRHKMTIVLEKNAKRRLRISVKRFCALWCVMTDGTGVPRSHSYLIFLSRLHLLPYFVRCVNAEDSLQFVVAQRVLKRKFTGSSKPRRGRPDESWSQASGSLKIQEYWSSWAGVVDMLSPCCWCRVLWQQWFSN